MSSWSYIRGTIEVRPMGRTQAERTYILSTVLDHLPVVAGSEEDMQIFVNLEKGDNESSSCDEHGMETNNLKDRYGNRDRRGWLRLQSSYHLDIIAYLRDVEFDEAYRAFMKWLCRLAKRVQVEDVLVRVYDGYKRALIDTPHLGVDNKYLAMFEPPTWCSDSNDEYPEPNWCEYLMWDRAYDSDYPMMLGYKYFNDKDNDNEVERRIDYLRRGRSDKK